MFRKDTLDENYLYQHKNVQEMYDEIIFQTEEAFNLFVRTIQVSKVLKNKPPWINQSLKSLKRYKNN